MRTIDIGTAALWAASQRVHDLGPNARPPPANEAIIPGGIRAELLGRSRRGAPDRKTQRMPLRTLRSFTRGTPRGLLGSMGLMAVHSSWVSSKRMIRPLSVRGFRYLSYGAPQLLAEIPCQASRYQSIAGRHADRERADPHCDMQGRALSRPLSPSLTARATSQTFRARQINGIMSRAEASAPGAGPITTKTSPWTTSHRSRAHAKATRSALRSAFQLTSHGCLLPGCPNSSGSGPELWVDCATLRHLDSGPP
jgi:hypothetical protein